MFKKVIKIQILFISILAVSCNLSNVSKPKSYKAPDLPKIHFTETDYGNQYYVSQTGTNSAQGTKIDPFSLEYAFSGAGEKILPGDVVWIEEGTYYGKFEVSVSGNEDKPVLFRAEKGKRVTIDTVNTRNAEDHSTQYAIGFKGSHVWLWGLEITCSDSNRWYDVGGSNPTGMFRRGGLRVTDGEGIRVINCIIHDAGGIAVWKSSKDIEIYGCLSYNNGWVAPDRGHTHGNYMQSYKGNRKYFSESIMFNNFGGYGHHVYGSGRADLFDFTLIGNLNCDNTLLFGGGSSSTSRAGNIAVCEEMTYRASSRIGYGKSPNEDVLVLNNYFSNGLELCYWRNAKVFGNTFLSNFVIIPTEGIPLADQLIANNNSYLSKIRISGGETYELEEWQDLGYDSKSSKITRTNKVFIRPNRYEEGRAHIIIYNWEKQSSINLDLSIAGLNTGDNFELRNAFDFYGDPVMSGEYSGSISLQMKDYTYAEPVGITSASREELKRFIKSHPGEVFGAFVLIKK